MVEEPSVREMLKSKPWRMPGMPAWPKNRAHRDQAKAARVPTETRVSMVAAPCRALVQAARWKGSAPQTTAGAASVSESHCQLSNWRAGTMASRTTGSESAAETSSRWRRAAVSGSAAGRFGASVSASAPASGSGAGGGGSSAVYPVFTTVAIRSATSTPEP